MKLSLNQDQLYNELIKRNHHNQQIIKLYCKTMQRKQQKTEMNFVRNTRKTDILTQEVRFNNKKELMIDIGEQKTADSSLKDFKSLHQVVPRIAVARITKPTSKDPKPEVRKKISLDMKAPIHLQNVVFRMMRVQKVKVSLRKKNNASLPFLFFDRNQPLMEFTFKQD